MKIPYTGCNPRGLILARGKDLSKTLVHHHRIAVPAFASVSDGPQGETAAAPCAAADRQEPERGWILRDLASIDRRYGQQLAERVAFVHQQLGTAAIAEQYIEGRELYVGVLGNNRLRVLPVWELKFGILGGQGARQIATKKAKHESEYQERVGIVDGPAKDLAPEVYARIQRTAKRIYKTLGLDGYARIDFRLSPDGTPYFIEANPNPEIAKSQEFATAAKHDGLDYPDLLHRILALGISRAKAGASVG